MEKIGMVGVGAMGSALLERLKLAGAAVVAYDIAPEALEAARAAGAEIAASAKAVAQAATIVDIVVRKDQEILDCAMGKDGVFEGAKPGALVILHSTILPQTTRRVAEAAGPRGIDVIDACMIGVPSVVREGKLSFVVGGPKEVYDRARPHLLKMSKQTLHMGPLGAGNVSKLVKNLVGGSETLIIHEAIQIAEAAGIAYPEALEMMRQVYSGTLLNRWQKTFDPSGSSPMPGSGHNVFDKDIPLAGELARQYGLSLPITEQLVAAGKRIVKAKSAR